MAKRKDYSYLLLAGIVLIIMLAVFLVAQIFPFGDNSFLSYDFYYQVAGLTQNIFNAFAGRSSLFFTFDLAGGCSVFASILFACFSPFTFILLLGGQHNVRYLTPLMITLKFITIALVFLWFLKKQFRLNNIWNILLSLLYTFSSYCLMAVTWPVWLDLAIYFPLLFVAFKHMKQTGKVRYVSLVLSIMILTSFSLSIFTMLYLLVIFVGYLFFCIKKEERGRLCFKFILAYAIAIACTLFVVIPSLVEMLHSPRMGNLWSTFSNTSPLTMMNSKFGFLLASCLPIVLSVMAIVKNFKNSRGKFYLFVFIVCLLPILIDGINVAINFSRYAGYPLRLGALFNFVFIYLSATYLNRKEEFEEEHVKKSKVNMHLVIICLLCVLSLIIGIINVLAFAGSIANASFHNITLICLCLFFALCLLTLMLSRLNSKKSRISKKTSKFVNIVVCSILILFSALMYLSGSKIEIGAESNYYKYQTSITAEDKYARVKSRLSMAGLDVGYSSISGFSSMIDKNAIDTYQILGYTHGFHDINTNNGNLFADMLSGIRFEISDCELDLPYLRLVEQQEDSYLYEYNLYLGHAFYANELPVLEEDDDLITRHNKIYKAVSGDEENLITKLDAKLDFDVEPTLKDEYLKFDECVGSVSLTAEKDMLVYIEMDSKYRSISFNERPVSELGSTLLGFVHAGENKTFNIEFEKGSKVKDYFIYKLDYKKLEELNTKLNLTVPKVGYTKDSISVEFTGEAKYLVINHPQIYGYDYNLNGESTEVESFIGFACFNISGQTAGVAKIAYTYPSLKLSLAGLCAGVLLVALLIVLCYVKNPNKRFLRFCEYALITFATALCVYYFVIPMVAIWF